MPHPEKIDNAGVESASGSGQAGLQGGTSPGSEDLDPLLVEWVEEFTRRILAGETVDPGEFVRAHPEWAEMLEGLLPAMRGLAEVGQLSESEKGVPTAVDREGAGGRVFGNFRVGGEVGRGGMGIVYEAEQVTLGRRVALKVLPLAAALDPRALQRFQLEAQVAGWLRHPRIVPVYDVGLVGDVPYYAMPFIEGGSLADVIAELRVLNDRRQDSGYEPASDSAISSLAVSLLSGHFVPPRREAEEGRAPIASASKLEGVDVSVVPSIRGRAYFRTVARLGVQAGEALSYAHDQGIVHRDIKPANLLLDLRGELWVADFGMADVQGVAGVTLTGDLPGTLRYMSPEQALGRRALVDRRTDLYSLGATLYELLTLRPAITGDERQDVLRTIAEEEPTPIRRLNPAVPVDLATIVGKAMSKDPSNRYETALHLAEDLRRFLDGLPISARPVGPLTWGWRWCRRKPLQAGLAAALGLALVVGVGGIAWNWREAERQKQLLLVAEKEARTQAAKADAINRFLIDGLLVQAEPENTPAARRVTLLEILDRAASGVGTSFADQPEVEATIRLAIGRIYHGLGEYAKSETHDRAAFERFGSLPGGVRPGRLQAMSELGHNLSHLGRWREAEPLLAEAVRETRRVLGPYDPISLRSAEYLAEVYKASERLAEAEALYRNYLEDARRAPKPEMDILFSGRFNLADTLHRRGKSNEAEVIYRQILNDRRNLKGPRHPDTLSTLNNLGVALEKQTKFTDAERLFRECLELNREVRGPNHPETLTVLYNLGHALNDLGRLDEAEALFRESIALRRQVLGPEHPGTLYVISSLASLLRTRGRHDEALAMLQPCLETQRRLLGPDHPNTVMSATRLDHLLKDLAAPRNAQTSRGPTGPNH